MTKIPNVIHYIFGLKSDFGGKPFSFLHYLAVKSAYVLNKPDSINIHCKYVPEGEWWDKARELVNVREIEPPDEIFGNPLLTCAHKTDLMRLEILKKYGGIYLDMDVVCLRSFEPLLQYDFVMGQQARRGLCNAVILSKPGAAFLDKWHLTFKKFRSRGHDEYWDEHAVIIPSNIARENPEDIHIVDKYSFFWPLYDNPRALWHNYSKWDALGNLMNKNALRVTKRSFSMHLWEQLWWDKYLANLTPDIIRQNDNNFSRLLKKIVFDESAP